MSKSAREIFRNIAGSIKRTPLHWALYRNSPDLIRLLLQSDAAPDAVDEFGNLPIVGLGAGFQNSYPLESLKLMHVALPIDFGSAGPGPSVLITATLSGCEAAMTWLFEQGADWSNFGKESQTLLHFAARMCNHAALRSLLKHGGAAYLEARNVAGWTPLHVAAYRGYGPLWKNCCVHTRYDFEELHLKGYYETIVELIQAGADITARTVDDPSLTPYELATASGPEERRLYLDALGATGKELPLDAGVEYFWDTCNGDCSNGEDVSCRPIMIWCPVEHLI